MTTTTSVSGTSSTSTAATSSSSSSIYDQMADIDFLTLLVTELQYQDPLSPMENTELMSQMASLTTVQELQDLSEAINSLNSTNQYSYAASLVGKYVAYEDSEGETVSGQVGFVDISDAGNIVLVTTDSTDIPLSSVQYIASGE